MANGISGRPLATCTVGGCAAPIDSDYLCGTHWQRWKRYGNPLAMADRTCEVSGCEAAPKARNLCGKHYQRFRSRGTTDDSPRREAAPCASPDCERVSVARGMCSTHYARWKREGDRPEGQACAFSSCGKNAVRRGYCQSHGRQSANEEPLRPVRSRVENGTRLALIRDSEGRKRCGGCHQWLPTTAFGKAKANVDGLVGYCKMCRTIVGRRTTLRLYGLTPDSFGAMVSAQGGSCAVCAEEFTRTPHVDHDHSCCASTPTCGNCTRGILCHSCNVAIGLMRDDPTRLERAAGYLRNA